MKVKSLIVVQDGKTYTLDLLVPLSQEAIERATKAANVEIQAMHQRMYVYEQQLRSK